MQQIGSRIVPDGTKTLTEPNEFEIIKTVVDKLVD